MSAVWPKFWADKEETDYRFCITLALWSVTSVWILSSVSFFNSWQLFSLWGDNESVFLQSGFNDHWFLHLLLVWLPRHIRLHTLVSWWPSLVVSPTPSFPCHAATPSCPPGCSELSALYFDPVRSKKNLTCSYPGMLLIIQYCIIRFTAG